jgi:hypothetical protein
VYVESCGIEKRDVRIGWQLDVSVGVGVADMAGGKRCRVVLESGIVRMMLSTTGLMMSNGRDDEGDC